MSRWTWALAVLIAVVGSVGTVSAQDQAADKVWRLWSQHHPASGGLWWRSEAGPFTEAECRTQLKRASSRPKVGFTKWYDITPQYLEKLYGAPATPDKGTWIACWPAPLDFDRDLEDR